ncbi:DUF3796 domain-containing protein [Enterococcus mundtii]|uniref:DUF3796 domain-containing protein n=1 Tax=Enterococcus mundtii TaxID=53346 RepID=UPI000E02F5E0|nr:DUF3796 domain-containing protein [Enterococcus mundtii]STD22318.1 Uncharacterised protein [Enterococcus mundtii]
MRKGKADLGFLGLLGILGFLGYLPNLSGLFSLFALFSLFGFFWITKNGRGLKDFFTKERVLTRSILLKITIFSLLLAYVLTIKLGELQAFVTIFFSMFFSLLIVLNSYLSRD